MNRQPSYDYLEYGVDDRILRRYLLRDLEPQHLEQVEKRLFFEEGFFKRAEIVESELVEEYVRGALPAPERRRFEKNYLCTTERRQRVQMTRYLAGFRPVPVVEGPSPVIPIAALRASVQRSAPKQPSERSPSETRSRGTVGVWAWRAVAASVVLAFATGVWYFSNQSPDVNRGTSGTEITSDSKRPYNMAPPTLDRALPLAMPGGELPVIRIPNPVPMVRLRWDRGSLTGEKYPAALETMAGGQVWSGEASALASGELAITLPQQTLEPGRYRIRLLVSETGGDVTIEFEVVQESR